MEKHLLKNGKELTIRLVKIEEVQEFLNYINQCGKETDFLGFGEEGIGLTLEDEEKQIKNSTDKNFMLVALVDNKIVGSCSLRTNESRMRLKHIALLGITILKEYWGIGIGKNLLNSAIKRGKKTGITRFELTVRTDNKNAIALYNKLGFEIEGRLKNAMFIKDKYFDNYIMGLVI
ncbi:putative acetyltransferase YhhY [Fusobacterium necrogenes]|uniref:Putative acetyltransferase YhhY n=1 Tax=Fusobacterium necrogenes TaxID=858 RepID=A0A377GV49_9FUSO|nr:GNAT family N-acetyltransferase [Fusobacterium necrogenes]STO30857.1 putative acetyltransferase YhhY [Fusobacterium necrogenes]